MQTSNMLFRVPVGWLLVALILGLFCFVFSLRPPIALVTFRVTSGSALFEVYSLFVRLLFSHSFSFAPYFHLCLWIYYSYSI